MLMRSTIDCANVDPFSTLTDRKQSVVCVAEILVFPCPSPDTLTACGTYMGADTLYVPATMCTRPDAIDDTAAAFNAA